MEQLTRETVNSRNGFEEYVYENLDDVSMYNNITFRNGLFIQETVEESYDTEVDTYSNNTELDIEVKVKVKVYRDKYCTIEGLRRRILEDNEFMYENKVGYDLVYYIKTLLEELLNY